MHSLASQPTTDPTSIYRYRDGLYAADLLAAALVGLDFFTWLHEHPSDQAAICRALSPPSISSLHVPDSTTAQLPALPLPSVVRWNMTDE